MTKHFTGILLLFVFTLRAQAQDCVQDRPGRSAANAGSIRVTVGAGVSSNDVTCAFDMWATCDEYATGFPQFSTSSGEITINIDYSASAPAGAGCGEYTGILNGSGHLVGGSITIFGTYDNGISCAGFRIETIAHELGHVLGLENVDCLESIMGPPGLPRTVRPEECSEVEDNWDTPTEQQQETCNATCPVACTGTPLSCPNSTGGGGEGPYCGSSGCHTPLILDLAGDGIATSPLENGVWFDMSGDGHLDRTAWTVADSDDALLYIDENLNGVIDGAKELFGDLSMLPNGETARHGFEALARYDRNGDGLISPGDAVWGKLRLWVDRSHDGSMTADEDYSLGQLQIVDIALSFVRKSAEEGFGRDESGNLHLMQGTFRRRLAGEAPSNIVTRVMTDVLFRVELR